MISKDEMEIPKVELDRDQASSLRELARQKVEKEKKGDTKHTTPLPDTQKGGTISRVITITSGKGGVGKTTISVNLAIALAKTGRKVLLFDADLGLANINVLLGVIPKYNLYHVVKGTKKLKDIILTTTDGLDIIAGASGYSILANLNVGERERIIKEFETLGSYDIMLIDTGAGVSSNVIGFTLPADEIIVLTTPEPTAITDAYGIIKSIVLSAPDKAIKLLVNRVTSSLEAKKVLERVANISNQFLNVRVESAGFIFEDEHVAKSVRRQKPFYNEYPRSKAAGCMQLVAGKLVSNGNLNVDARSIGGFFKKLFGA